MYAIRKIASIHITSAGCYFEEHPLRLVEPNLQPLLDDTNSYILSYWLTISGTNLPCVGPAAAMVDVGDRQIRHIVQKKWKIGRMFEEAQHLRILSFVQASIMYVVEQEQSFHNHHHK